MLSSSEARRLAQLEASLLDDDPDFVQGFRASWQETHRRALPLWVLWAYVPVVVTALVIPEVGLALVALGMTVVVAHLWRSGPATPRRRDEGPRRSSPERR
jgi:hypothetical protein